jgi:hypothetical protein
VGSVTILDFRFWILDLSVGDADNNPAKLRTDRCHKV